MRELSHLFANNRAWAGRIRTEDPEFFRKLSHQQAPQYFWLGFSLLVLAVTIAAAPPFGIRNSATARPTRIGITRRHSRRRGSLTLLSASLTRPASTSSHIPLVVIHR
jgi:hypothetical protein